MNSVLLGFVLDWFKVGDFISQVLWLHGHVKSYTITSELQFPRQYPCGHVLDHQI